MLSKIFNISLFSLSTFVVIKCSSIPYIPFLDNEIIRVIFDKLSYGNTELSGVALSIIASYIFYLINVYLPRKRKRKLVIETINTHVSQLAYRVFCLIYLHQEVGRKVSKDLLVKAYRFISHDIESKGNYILSFSEYLEIEEVISINSIMNLRNKYTMSHRKLDDISKTLKNDVLFLMESYKSPSPHNHDIDWLEETEKGITFKKDSNSFKLFIVDLIDIDKNKQFMNIDSVGGYYRKHFVVPAISKALDEIKGVIENHQVSENNS